MNKILPFFKKKSIIHLVGIGGSGMSSIAEILFYSGYKITGSDINFKNKRIKLLLLLGIKIFSYHSKFNILNVDLVVYSSAISKLNPEIIYAIKKNIPVLHRAEFIYELVRYKYTISVIGSHGKTTTTSMVFDILRNCNFEINCINGGNLKSINSYSYLSNSDYFLMELDESDGSFLYINPLYVILNNIDYDHLNNYSNKIENLVLFFLKFLKRVPFYGCIILCIDNFFVNKIYLNEKFNCKVITYGFSKFSNFRILNYYYKNNNSYFTLSIYNKKFLDLKLPILGKHNILNAVSALCLVKNITYLSLDLIKKSFKKIMGVERRLDLIGKFNFSINNIIKIKNLIIINDYGHHPTEINYLVKTIRDNWKKKRIIMLFQPHRYSRTNSLLNSFINSLIKVDILLLFPIYSSNEINIFNINSNNIINVMYNIFFSNVVLINSFNEVMFYLLNIIKNNDIIVFQGAGNITNIVLSRFVSYIRKNKL